MVAKDSVIIYMPLNMVRIGKISKRTIIETDFKRQFAEFPGCEVVPLVVETVNTVVKAPVAPVIVDPVAVAMVGPAAMVLGEVVPVLDMPVSPVITEPVVPVMEGPVANALVATGVDCKVDDSDVCVEDPFVSVTKLVSCEVVDCVFVDAVDDTAVEGVDASEELDVKGFAVGCVGIAVA